MIRPARCSASLLLSAFIFSGLRGQTVALEGVVVAASRSEQASATVPFSVTTFSGEKLRTLPATTLDSALRTLPGFNLFRRSDSLTANPTAQGVSLRGLGPSGASRSLVLLDGVPLNDPFGGWVAWSKVPRDSLSRAEIVPGGGATAWGNAALGGVVQLITEPPVGERGRVSAMAGDFETRSAEVSVAQPVGPGTFQVLGRAFSTEGFRTVSADRIGSIDTPAGDRHGWLTGRWRQAVNDRTTVTLTGRYYRETRGNGTPYQENSTRETFGSAVVDAQPEAGFDWNATVYGQDQNYTQTFSSVNAARTAETPASEQYSVPATAWGAAWTGTWRHANGARTSAGVDAREVRGETRENFTFSGGAYTKRRFAGGKQGLGGLFALHQRMLAPNLSAMVGARVDYWRETAGHRREFDIASGAVSRDDLYPDRDGWAFSPSAGLIWKGPGGVRWRAAAQQSFRRPTLNELYRPFRVGTVITEANPDLKTESVQSAEIGASYATGPFAGGVTAFWNELHDAVTNVTLARGPGTFPLFGVIPAGGAGRQRLNVERIRVRGIELTGEWKTRQNLSFTGNALVEEATVRRASAAPNLVGLRLAEVPRFTASAGAVWQGRGGWSLSPRLRWVGAQFEDDENQLRLGEVVVLDLGASWLLGRGLEIFVTVENVGDTRIETGRSSDGVVNTGIPRFASGGVRWSW
jgi:outer membrane receptor protein involved in Fe transport